MCQARAKCDTTNFTCVCINPVYKPTPDNYGCRYCKQKHEWQQNYYLFIYLMLFFLVSLAFGKIKNTIIQYNYGGGGK